MTEALVFLGALLVCGLAWAYAIDAVFEKLMVDDGKSKKEGDE